MGFFPADLQRQPTQYILAQTTFYSTMAEEERPRKLPKLGHDDESTHEALGPAMTGAVAPGDEMEHTSTGVGGDLNPDLSVTAGEIDALNTVEATVDDNTENADPKMSKKQLKRLRRKEKWDQDKDWRKNKRKEQQARKKERRQRMIEEAREQGGEEAVKELRKTWEGSKAKRQRSTQLPLAIVIDCGYDDLMLDKERISLASQLTRSYSENTRATWRSHLMFSSFNKLLKERFDTILAVHKNWKGIKIIPEDFMHAADLAKSQMTSSRGGKLVGPFAETDAKPEDGEVIYLSSDSPHTLTELKPYDTYIIGGLVDKNRHKGICHKHALEAGVKTAKLPIGDYIQMVSRQVLATNHVVDIMLKWLELGDWGEALMKVLPPRKGGKLKDQTKDVTENNEENDRDSKRGVTVDEDEEQEESTTMEEIAKEMEAHEAQEEEDEEDEDDSKEL